jgi:hypothetical protein
MIPGMNPPRNRAPTEVLSTPPHTTIRMLGGMITPITEEQAVMATVKEVS